MSSHAEDTAACADLGLLGPVWAGTRAEQVTGDRAVLSAMVRTEAALVRALVDTGVLPAAASAAADAVTEAEVDVRTLARRAVPAGNPVVPLVDALRAGLPAEQVQWVHHGATSQDVLDTALMLVAAETARLVETDLTRLADGLARLARQARSVPLVARTLSQQALPSTLGMRVSGWLAGVHDAVRAVRTCTRLPVSLAGPVGTAAAYGGRGPAVVDALAGALGQVAPVSGWHTRRTPVVGVATALTAAGTCCAKIAADVLVMAQNEVGEAREGTPGTSSSMPHKANPTRAVLVSSAARQLPALASVLAGSAHPEQERPAGAWHAEWQTLRSMLRLSAGAVERTVALLDDVTFDHDAMRRNLAGLLATLGEDDSFVRAHTAHAGTWVDRVLAQHEEVFG